ncbi:MAG: LLM class F420-dependent oxidoreductase, partial [Acidimicrobiia bacterium]|nr:LLM class F420-dependent oxidoreductase [Acidimicrobiia bacterium]
MSDAPRWGLTIPFDGVPLHEQKQWIEEVVAAGYTDLWSSEAGSTDGFTPL